MSSLSTRQEKQSVPSAFFKAHLYYSLLLLQDCPSQLKTLHFIFLFFFFRIKLVAFFFFTYFSAQQQKKKNANIKRDSKEMQPLVFSFVFFFFHYGAQKDCFVLCVCALCTQSHPRIVFLFTVRRASMRNVAFLNKALFHFFFISFPLLVMRNTAGTKHTTTKKKKCRHAIRWSGSATSSTALTARE